MRHQPKALDTKDTEARPIRDDITILIPTLGRPILEECLHWIVAGSVWPGGLIAVDQGANPKVAGWVEALRPLGINAVYVPSSQHGRAAGLNRGIERVGTRFVAVTDDDCFVESDWVERMVKRLQENPQAVVTGRVEAAGDDVLVVVTSPVPAVQRRPRLKFDSMSGGNLGTSMWVIERVGPFDEDLRLRTAEDAEWSYRVLRAGVPIIYAPEVAVRHFGWRDEGERATQYRYYARSHGGFYGKYLRRGDWFIALRVAVHHGRALRRCLGGVMSGDRELALLGWSYFTGLLPGIVAGLQRDRVA
jgi:hypothetical protein